jgi:hypothetical protein
LPFSFLRQFQVVLIRHLIVTLHWIADSSREAATRYDRFVPAKQSTMQWLKHLYRLRFLLLYCLLLIRLKKTPKI